MTALIILAVTASVAANSVVQLALGVDLVVSAASRGRRRLLVPAAAMLFSGLLCWPLFAYVLSPLALGFLEPLLLFPLASLVSVVTERVMAGRHSGPAAKSEGASAYAAFGGLAYGSAWLSFRLSSSMLDVLVVSVSCAAGFIVSGVLLDGIRHRSLIEGVPRTLRGMPLVLISAGLLALLSSFVASAAFTALGVGR